MAIHLPLTALRAFEAVARHLSFRKAAEELHVTPAAVSQQIKTLEDLLGHPLFHRLPRSLVLTKTAQAGLPLVHEGLEQLGKAMQLMQTENHSETLTAWMAPSFASKWLIPRLPRFLDEHVGIDMSISASTGLIDDLRATGAISADDLRRHGVDVAIRFGQGQYPGCRVDKLFDVTAVPLCSPALLEGEHPLGEPQDLQYHTLLHDDTVYEGRPGWSSWLEAAGVDDIDASRGLHFNHASLALEAAVDGQGVALSLRPLAEADLAAGRLVVPFNLALPISSAYYLISLAEDSERPEITAFHEWLLFEAAAAAITD
jgi:LysR family glycine cleavage system transcriptional activator